MQFIIAIIIAIILYTLQARYYKKHWSDALDISITYDKSHAQIGDTITLTEQIANRKAMPIPVLAVKFRTARSFVYEQTENVVTSDYNYRNDIFSILGHQQISRQLTFQPTERGYFTIDKTSLVVNDLFLQKNAATIADNFAFLYVYPRLLQSKVEQFYAQSIIGDILAKTLYKDPLTFRGLREYIPSDDMHSINWKSTAKQQQLMVNTYYDTAHANIVLLVNFDTNRIERDNTLKEYLVCVAATLITNMNQQGISYSLHANAKDCITQANISTASACGKEHLQSTLETLCRLQYTDTLENFSDMLTNYMTEPVDPVKNTTFVILSNYRKPDLCEACERLKQTGHSVHFICPEFRSYYSNEDFAITLDTNTKKYLSDVHFWEVSSYEF